MKFKDKYTIFIKNQKEISLSTASFLVALTIIALVIANLYYSNIRIGKYEYKPIMEDAIFRATFVGDVMMGRSIGVVGKKQGYDTLFKKVKNLWKDSNYVSCNFKNAVLNSSKKYMIKDKKINTFADKKSVTALKKAGFNVVSIANNYVANYGRKGIEKTINTFEEKELEFVGAGRNIEEATKYNIKEVNGLKIATIAVSDKILKNSTATRETTGILTTAYPEYPLIISNAKEKADIVIVNMFWGNEYTYTVTQAQEEIAYNLINAGADIIIGTSQNVVQTIEKYNDGIIFYGMGNLISDLGWEFTKEGAITNFSINEEGKYIFEVIPIYIEGQTPEATKNKYHSKKIFNRLTKRLKTTQYKIENNRLIIEGNFNINKEAV